MKLTQLQKDYPEAFFNYYGTEEKVAGLDVRKYWREFTDFFDSIGIIMVLQIDNYSNSWDFGVIEEMKTGDIEHGFADLQTTRKIAESGVIQLAFRVLEERL